MNYTKEQAIQRIIEGLHCDLKEAEEIYNYDKAVDRGEKTEFDLSPDKEKIAKKFAHTGTRKSPPAYKFTKRERKPNATKGGIIAELANFLANGSQYSVVNLNITNKERMITFEIGENKFDLTLIQKRKPKGEKK